MCLARHVPLGPGDARLRAPPLKNKVNRQRAHFRSRHGNLPGRCRGHVPVRRRGARWFFKALCRVLSPCGRGSGWGRWKGGSLTAFSKFLGLLNCVQRLHGQGELHGQGRRI